MTSATERQYHLITEPSQLWGVLARVQQEKVISIDTETSNFKEVGVFQEGFKLVGISIAVTENEAYYIPLNHQSLGPDDYQTPNIPEASVRNFMEMVYMHADRVVYHNASFDRMVLFRGLGLPHHMTGGHDTVIMAHLMNENQELGLKPLAQKYLRIQPEVTKIPDSFQKTVDETWIQTHIEMVPNKLGRLYKKTIHTPVKDWVERMTSYFRKNADGAASFGYVTGLLAKTLSQFKKRGIEGYEPTHGGGLDFRYVPTEMARVYASDDVMNTLALYKLWTGTFFDLNPELWDLFVNLETRMDDIMTRATIHGIKTNADYLRDLGWMLEDRMEKAQQDIMRVLDQVIDWADPECPYTKDTLLSSPKQLSHLLYNDFKFPVVETTDKGTPSTSKTALAKLKTLKPRNPKRKKDTPFIMSFLDLKGQISDIQKIKSTYTQSLIDKCDENLRVHPNYNIAGTVSGRLSSNDPNWQNMPRLLEEEIAERPWLMGVDIRKAFEADDDYVFIGADYTSMEMVACAALSGDETLRDLLNNGRDLHCHTARYAFKVGFDMDDKTFKKKHKMERQKAKIVNFA